jgi:hypothetical protein
MLRITILAGLLAVTGCASSPIDPDASPWERAEARQRDLTRSGSVATRTGLEVPLALCSRAARILPATRRLAGMCAQGSRL